jgi:hypothetical protein
VSNAIKARKTQIHNIQLHGYWVNKPKPCNRYSLHIINIINSEKHPLSNQERKITQYNRLKDSIRSTRDSSAGPVDISDSPTRINSGYFQSTKASFLSSLPRKCQTF